MRALIEEVIGAVAVPEIVEAPRFTARDAGTDRVLIDEHIDRAQIALKVLRVCVRARQLRGRQSRIVLRGLRCGVTKPGLEFKEREGLLRVKQLRRDRRAGAMARDPPARVCQWHTGFSTEGRNQRAIQIIRRETRTAYREEKVHELSRLLVESGWLERSLPFPRASIAVPTIRSTGLVKAVLVFVTGTSSKETGSAPGVEDGPRRMQPTRNRRISSRRKPANSQTMATARTIVTG
jgi:hypothetical protein